MSVAKVTEITASSSKSFANAIRKSIKRAGRTLKNVRSAWIKNQRVIIEKGKIAKYSVTMNFSSVGKD